MQGELYSGRYTEEEVRAILDINARPLSIMKPLNPFYKKTAYENAPTWQ
jgi:hypothetical protein